MINFSKRLQSVLDNIVIEIVWSLPKKVIYWSIIRAITTDAIRNKVLYRRELKVDDLISLYYEYAYETKKN